MNCFCLPNPSTGVFTRELPLSSLFLCFINNYILTLQANYNNMSLKSNQLDALLEKAKGLLDSTLVIRNKAFKFKSIGVVDQINSKGDPERFTVNGNLVSEDGDMLQKPLTKIVEQLEKNAAK